MKKVMQIIGQLRIGGAETVAMNLYRYIDRTKFEFHYLVYGDSVGEYEEEVTKLGGKVIHISYSSNKINEFKKALDKVFKEYGPYDVVHAHMMFHNGLVLDVAKKNKIPIRISHAHSTNDGADRKHLLDCVIRAIYDAYFCLKIRKNANVYIACGNEAGCYLYGKKFFLKKGIVVKNGIDTDKFQFDEKKRKILREKYGLSDRHVYSSIGHFELVKNHKFIIDVFENINKKDNRAILILLGDGKLRRKIELMCRERGISENVRFMGNVKNVDEWLQAIDFLLMPSLYEGIPVTLIEAQAVGVKCFVSDRISEEVNYTNTIQFLSLENRQAWANIVNENVTYVRTDNRILTIKSGYDVKYNVGIIQQIYLDVGIN